MNICGAPSYSYSLTGIPAAPPDQPSGQRIIRLDRVNRSSKKSELSTAVLLARMPVLAIAVSPLLIEPQFVQEFCIALLPHPEPDIGNFGEAVSRVEPVRAVILAINR